MKFTLLAAALAPALALAPAGNRGPQEADTGLVSDAARDRLNPVAATPGAIAAGKLLWKEHCQTCHGSQGKGDGPNARLHQARKKVAPRDLSQPELQDNLSEGEIFWRLSGGIVEDGEVIMPAYREKVPSKIQSWQLVLFVRTLRQAQD